MKSEKPPKDEPAPLEIFVSDEVPAIKEQLKSKFKDPTRRSTEKVRSEQIVEDDSHRASGTWSKRNMIVDHDNNKYFEEIIDSTGKVIRKAEEPVDQHQGYGSAKLKRK
jgi:hypothetical protein